MSESDYPQYVYNTSDESNSLFFERESGMQLNKHKKGIYSYNDKRKYLYETLDKTLFLNLFFF